jgi:hypothetical protein
MSTGANETDNVATSTSDPIPDGHVQSGLTFLDLSAFLAREGVEENGSKII